jgi:hypothetical protein
MCMHLGCHVDKSQERFVERFQIGAHPGLPLFEVCIPTYLCTRVDVHLVRPTCVECVGRSQKFFVRLHWVMCNDVLVPHQPHSNVLVAFDAPSNWNNTCVPPCVVRHGSLQTRFHGLPKLVGMQFEHIDECD